MHVKLFLFFIKKFIFYLCLPGGAKKIEEEEEEERGMHIACDWIRQCMWDPICKA